VKKAPPVGAPTDKTRRRHLGMNASKNWQKKAHGRVKGRSASKYPYRRCRGRSVPKDPLGRGKR
jgi:hypothetical protein